MFRAAIQEGTELGVKAKSFMDQGALVPDEVTIGIVRERLSKSDCDKRISYLMVFHVQFHKQKHLNSILADMGRKIEHVLNIQVEKEELIARIDRPPHL